MTYINKIVATANGADTTLIGNQVNYAFETGDPSWRQLANAGLARPDGYQVDQGVSDHLLLCGVL